MREIEKDREIKSERETDRMKGKQIERKRLSKREESEGKIKGSEKKRDCNQVQWIKAREGSSEK